jgi:chemotaxis protein methyltransferase CheR
VLDALSVQETYFWREVDQIRAVACQVIPRLLSVNPTQPVRIWSIPCASGEEPLTIAMVLEETGLFSRGAIEIHGGDGSPAAIAHARQGRYRVRSFRALPEPLRQRYFEQASGYASVRPELQARVTSWNVVNLMALDAIGDSLAGCHIVFCRNAFIYFSPQSVRRVVDTLAETMPAPAYLCVGAAESLLNVTDRFSLEDVGGAFMYVKHA